jgi:nucleoside-diphosphate-sugar epimerase
LTDALVERGDEVVVLDNLSTGKRANLAGVLDRIRLVEASITDLPAVKECCAGVDTVFHQAALASVPRSVNDPIGSNETNVTGTLNVLWAAKECGVRRVVYAASSSAYGDTEVLPKREDMPANPLSPYAVNKYVGELYCAVFDRLYGLSTVGLRYFNVFGPRQDPQSQYAAVVPIFITRLLGGEAPVIHGDGEQSRDFTYIRNVVAANLLAAAAPQTGGQTVNIACGDRISLNDLFARLRALVGSELSPVYGPARAGDVKHSQADIAAAAQLIGFRPEVGLEEGLRETVAWYRAQGV